MTNTISKLSPAVLQGVKRRVAKAPTARTPEGKVKNKVKDLLDSLTDCWYFMPVGGMMGRAGVPDFVGCYKGRMFGVETKSIYSSHKVTKLQQRQLDLISKSGGVALVINEDNVDALLTLLGGKE